LRHSQKSGVKPRTTGHAERNIGKPQICLTFKNICAPMQGFECFVSGERVGGNSHNQTIDNNIIFGETGNFCLLKDIFYNRLPFCAVCGTSPPVRAIK